MPEVSTPSQVRNRVLQAGHRPSDNFHASDLLLRAELSASLDGDAQAYLAPLLTQLGKQAATEMDALSLAADKNVPELVKRDTWGETVNQIRFHPAYWQLMQISVDAQMMRLKWEPTLRQRFAGQRHRMGFALGYLYAMSESGQYCPLCMTDGVAHLIDRFCTDEDRDRLLPHIYSERLADFYTGAMFLTEKAGGSDVGANLVRATETDQLGYYALEGEKWFCSNVNAQIIFALARTQPEVTGTRGLSIFLVERSLPDGSPNPIEIVRLKDKLGTRSMASGECLLQGTQGKLIGAEFKGFAIMAEMINLSRMYNSVAALAGGRRALIEAYQFLGSRITFGKIALEHALVRAKLWELGSLHRASHALVWRAITAMDRAEIGDAAEAQLLRVITPMVKRDSAALAVYICRESMELMGGMGYIEDTVIPKTMRDVMVLPIWEGAGNIMVLDMLRASAKSEGLAVLREEIAQICQASGSEAGRKIQQEANALMASLHDLRSLSQDEMEFQAEGLFQRLTRCYQAALLLRESTTMAAALSVEWILQQGGLAEKRSAPPSVEEIHALVGWEV